jgi:hypothetical protein
MRMGRKQLTFIRWIGLYSWYSTRFKLKLFSLA